MHIPSITIYIDGSKTRSGTGYAFLCVQRLSFNFYTENKVTNCEFNYQAKLLEFVSSLQSSPYGKFILYSDSLSDIQAIKI